MTPFSQLIASISPAAGEPDNAAAGADSFQIAVTDDWLQGRTLYGGLSAALCVEAATRAYEGLPPLQSAQFAFVGPASGQLRLTPSILRKGKSTVFVSVDLVGDAGIATRATLCFGAPRASRLSYQHLPMPQVPPPESCKAFRPRDQGPSFARHFDFLHAGGALPLSGADKPELLIWLRHVDRSLPNAAVPLIALADAPPPAAFSMFPEFAPISTMTWTIDMLSDLSGPDDGWRLLLTTGESIANGYSSQAMTVWDSTGKPLIAARQSVALFL
jgi:acyl-CoA thioesterase